MAKTVCFLSWHFKTPEVFLDGIRKQTPGNSGVWKDMTAITDPFQADYVIVMDGYKERVPEDRVIYFGAHPKVEGFSPSFRTFTDKQCLARVRLDRHLNPGEWWIEWDYDTIAAFQPPKKSKTIACAMTYQTHNAMYAQRVKFMHALATHTKYSSDTLALLDLYGRPQERFEADAILSPIYKGVLGHNNPDGYLNQHTHGKTPLAEYVYTLDYDVGPTQNYISERFYDSLFMWCHPIYFGSSNVHEFVPQGAFHYIDIYDDSKENIDRLREIVQTPPDLTAMAEARDLLLNKYQLWPYIYDVIHNLDRYQ